VPTGKYLAVLGSVRPGWSKLRLVSQEEKLFFDLIKQPVCRTGIVRRDIQPDINQVFFGV
jgi:hypothetical protein